MYSGVDHGSFFLKGRNIAWKNDWEDALSKKVGGQRKNSFKSSLVGLKSAHRRSVLVWISRQLQCTKSEFSTSNIFFAILNSSSFTEIDQKKIIFFSQFFQVDFYLRIASKAF